MPKSAAQSSVDFGEVIGEFEGQPATKEMIHFSRKDATFSHQEREVYMTELEREIRIVLQIALLGEVSPQVRAVAFTFDETSIHLDCFFEGEIVEEDRESMSLIETDLLAGYSETHEVSSALHRLDYPASIPGSKGWVYLRREDMSGWT